MRKNAESYKTHGQVLKYYQNHNKQNKIQSLFRSTSSMKSTAYFDWKNKKIGLKKSTHSLFVPHFFKFNYQFTKKSWCALKSLKHHKKNLFKKFVVKWIPVIFCWTHQEKKIRIKLAVLLFSISSKLVDVFTA